MARINIVLKTGEAMLLVFVHGWSVTNTDTYGGMPDALVAAGAAAGVVIERADIRLGRYISFHDEVRMSDLVRAFDHALRTDIPNNTDGRRAFSCVTHSTGGPVVREWLDWAYGDKLASSPLQHLVMLAPANHGSALAALGKGVIGRLKSGLNGIEPGQGVLDWLSLGSDESWSLAQRALRYDLGSGPTFPFVLAGDTRDRAFYDFVNHYLDESGSDGVVRLTGANLNYSWVRVVETDALQVASQDDQKINDPNDRQYRVLTAETVTRSPRCAFGIVPGASHSGDTIGIIHSVTPENYTTKPVVPMIINCLRVSDAAGYATQTDALARDNRNVEGPFVMFEFRVSDDLGRRIDDYDMVLLGTGYSAEGLPEGFFVDRQKNAQSQALTYYMDYEKLAGLEHLGFRIVARPTIGWPGEPTKAFSGYYPCEFRMTGADFRNTVKANETFYIDVVLKRHVTQETFRLTPLGQAPDFTNAKPGPVIA
jgi:hypothetical protein